MTFLSNMEKIVVKMPPRSQDRRTERGELLKEFLSVINAARKGTRYKPLTMGRMAKLLEGLTVHDLYYLKRVCEDSKNYSSRFFWELDAKKHL